MNLFKKSEKGSITIFVLTAMLLFLVVIVGVFVLYSNKVSDQQRAVSRIQNQYSVDNIDQVYEREEAEDVGIKASDISNAENKEEYYGLKLKGYDCENNAGVDSWEIFYADENNIYILAENYMEYDYIPYSTSNGQATSNKPATGTGMYSRAASFVNVIGDYPNGSSHILDSKIKSLNNDYFNTKGFESANNNMKAIAYMLDTIAWSGFAGEQAEYAIGGPTVEMILDSYNQKYGEQYAAEAKNAYGYKVSKDGTTWSDGISRMFKTSDPLYVINSTSTASGMWLASTSAVDGNRILRIHWNGMLSNDNYNAGSYGFRPLVCLKSSVRLEKNTDESYSILK